MMSVSILVRMPAIYILRRERVIRSVFVHVPVPGRAGVFTRRRVGEQARAVDPSWRANRRFVNKSTTSAEEISDLRLGGADFRGGEAGHIFCREVSAAGKIFMREDDYSWSLECLPGQFSPIRAKKPV